MNITNLNPNRSEYKQTAPSVFQFVANQSLKKSAAASGAEACCCSFGKAQVNMQKTDSLRYDFNSILEKIIDTSCQKVKRSHISRGRQYAQICEYIEEFGLHKTTGYAVRFPDDSDIYIFDKETGEISIYNENAELNRAYFREEVAALKYYKYHPTSLHFLLRENKEVCSGEFFEEAQSSIDELDSIFANTGKVFVNDKPRTLYRALQDKLSEEDAKNLTTIGGVFVDKSFVSTSTSLHSAQRFVRRNPILEIEFPVGAPYIDLDKLFNIDMQHWQEDEFLLNRNSKFQVTGFDKKNNIIKVKYLGV